MLSKGWRHTGDLNRFVFRSKGKALSAMPSTARRFRDSIPTQRLGAGLNNAELSLCLRYEITRQQFAPYVGFNSTWATRKAAGYVRASGDSPHPRSVVIGIRSWF
jgi:uncharacterized protein involved in copper resistance